MGKKFPINKKSSSSMVPNAVFVAVVCVCMLVVPPASSDETTTLPTDTTQTSAAAGTTLPTDTTQTSAAAGTTEPTNTTQTSAAAGTTEPTNTTQTSAAAGTTEPTNTTQTSAAAGTTEPTNTTQTSAAAGTTEPTNTTQTSTTATGTNSRADSSECEKDEVRVCFVKYAKRVVLAISTYGKHRKEICSTISDDQECEEKTKRCSEHMSSYVFLFKALIHHACDAGSVRSGEREDTSDNEDEKDDDDKKGKSGSYSGAYNFDIDDFDWERKDSDESGSSDGGQDNDSRGKERGSKGDQNQSGSRGSDQSGSMDSDESGRRGGDGSGRRGSNGSSRRDSDGSGRRGSYGSGRWGSYGSGRRDSDGSGRRGSDGSGRRGSDGSGRWGSDESGRRGSDESGSRGNDRSEEGDEEGDCTKPCDLQASAMCFLQFIDVLSQESVTAVCRQALWSARCMSSAVTGCRASQKHAVMAMVSKVMLTHGELCGSRSCQMEKAVACLKEAGTTAELLHDRSTLGPLLCGKLKGAFACVYNHSVDCSSDDKSSSDQSSDQDNSASDENSSQGGQSTSGGDNNSTRGNNSTQAGQSTSGGDNNSTTGNNSTQSGQSTSGGDNNSTTGNNSTQSGQSTSGGDNNSTTGNNSTQSGQSTSGGDNNSTTGNNSTQAGQSGGDNSTRTSQPDNTGSGEDDSTESRADDSSEEKEEMDIDTLMLRLYQLVVGVYDVCGTPHVDKELMEGAWLGGDLAYSILLGSPYTGSKDVCGQVSVHDDKPLLMTGGRFEKCRRRIGLFDRDDDYVDSEGNSRGKGSGEKSGSEESGEKSGSDESGEKSGSKESGEKSGSKESREKSGSKESREKSGSKESREKSGSKESREKSGSKESRERSGSKESRERSGSKDSWKASGSGESREKSGSKESREKSGSKESREKSGSKESREKSGSKESRERSGSKESRERSGSKESREKSGSKESREKSGSKDSWKASGSGESRENSKRKGRGEKSGDKEFRTSYRFRENYFNKVSKDFVWDLYEGHKSSQNLFYHVLGDTCRRGNAGDCDSSSEHENRTVVTTETPTTQAAAMCDFDAAKTCIAEGSDVYKLALEVMLSFGKDKDAIKTLCAEVHRTLTCAYENVEACELWQQDLVKNAARKLLYIVGNHCPAPSPPRQMLPPTTTTPAPPCEEKPRCRVGAVKEECFTPRSGVATTCQSHNETLYCVRDLVQPCHPLQTSVPMFLLGNLGDDISGCAENDLMSFFDLPHNDNSKLAKCSLESAQKFRSAIRASDEPTVRLCMTLWTFVRCYDDLDLSPATKYLVRRSQGLFRDFIDDHCKDTMEDSDTVPTCDQPRVTGPCEAAMPRYYYDTTMESCQNFTYGGCDGNQNKFDSIQDCEDKCIRVSDSSCDINKASTCLSSGLLGLFTKTFMPFSDRSRICREYTEVEECVKTALAGCSDTAKDRRDNALEMYKSVYQWACPPVRQEIPDDKSCLPHVALASLQYFGISLTGAGNHNVNATCRGLNYALSVVHATTFECPEDELTMVNQSLTALRDLVGNMCPAISRVLHCHGNASLVDDPEGEVTQPCDTQPSTCDVDGWKTCFDSTVINATTFCGDTVKASCMSKTLAGCSASDIASIYLQILAYATRFAIETKSACDIDITWPDTFDPHAGTGNCTKTFYENLEEKFLSAPEPDRKALCSIFSRLMECVGEVSSVLSVITQRLVQTLGDGMGSQLNVLCQEATSSPCEFGQPLKNDSGQEHYCGRGSSGQCPKGSACKIAPDDRYAVCCAKAKNASVQDCGTAPVDIMFVLDESSSIGAANFQIQLNFLKNLMDNPLVSDNVATGVMQLGLVTFSAFPENRFYLNTYDNVADMKDKIDTIAYDRRGTEIGKALKFVREESFTRLHGMRAEAPRIVILITDGASQDDSSTQADRLRENHVKILVIGIGNVNMDQLNAIASDPDRFLFTVTSFDQLATIRERVVKSIPCPEEPLSCRVTGAVDCYKGQAKSLFTGLYPVQSRATVCSVTEEYAECVTNLTAACSSEKQQKFLQIVDWTKKLVRTQTICEIPDDYVPVDCYPEKAMSCLAAMSKTIARYQHTPVRTAICSHMVTTESCVLENVRDCEKDHQTAILQAYNDMMTLARLACVAPALPKPSPPECDDQGHMCDGIEALNCLVAVHTRLVSRRDGRDAICNALVKAKECVKRHVSGCDACEKDTVHQMYEKLIGRVGHRCPQLFCERCGALQCIQKLSMMLENGNKEVCNKIATTKMCVEEKAHFCSADEKEKINSKLEIVVKTSNDLCENIGQQCFATFERTAWNILSSQSKDSTQSGSQSAASGSPSQQSSRWKRSAHNSDERPGSNEEAGSQGSDEDSGSKGSDEDSGSQGSDTSENSRRASGSGSDEELICEDELDKDFMPDIDWSVDQDDSRSSESGKSSSEDASDSSQSATSGGQATSGQATGSQATGGQATSGQATSGQATSGQTNSSQTTTGDAGSGEAQSGPSGGKSDAKGGKSKGKGGKSGSKGGKSGGSGGTKRCMTRLAWMCEKAYKSWQCLQATILHLPEDRQEVVKHALAGLLSSVQYKCAASKLQCFSCHRESSNAECNARTVETCAHNKQSCETVVDFASHVVTKGCVNPKSCHNKCTGSGKKCSYCCHNNLCNQQWDQVITESTRCLGSSAVTCAFSLVAMVMQSDEVSCTKVEAGLACMKEHTLSCVSSQYLAIKERVTRLDASALLVRCRLRQLNCKCGLCGSMALGISIQNNFRTEDAICRHLEHTVKGTALASWEQSCSHTDFRASFQSLALVWSVVGDTCALVPDSSNNTRTDNSSGQVTGSGETNSNASRSSGEAICDVEAAKECVNSRNTRKEFLVAMMHGFERVCSMEDVMKQCVTDNLSGCEADKAEDVWKFVTRASAWISRRCDDLANGVTNKCDLNNAMQCVYNLRRLENATQMCENKNKTVECVKNHTVSCLSVQVAPLTVVLGELMVAMGDICDGEVEIADDVYEDFARCVVTFGHMVHKAVTVIGSNTTSLTCAAMTHLQGCLYREEFPPLAKVYTKFMALMSTSFMKHICSSDEEERPLFCHRCGGKSGADCQSRGKVSICDPRSELCGSMSETKEDGTIVYSKGCVKTDACQSVCPSNGNCSYCCVSDFCNRGGAADPDKTTSSPEVVAEQAACEYSVADIVFLLDESSSIGTANYATMLQFVNNIIQRLNIEENHIHVGLATFADQGYAGFSLDTYFEAADMTGFVSTVIAGRYGTVSGTNVAEGLKFVRTQLFTGTSGDRPDVNNVIILLTDGSFTDYEEEVQNIRDANIDVVVMGIGSGVVNTQLFDVASDQSYVFSVGNFDALDTIVEEFVQILPCPPDPPSCMLDEAAFCVSGQLVSLLVTPFTPLSHRRQFCREIETVEECLDLLVVNCPAANTNDLYKMAAWMETTSESMCLEWTAPPPSCHAAVKRCLRPLLRRLSHRVDGTEICPVMSNSLACLSEVMEGDCSNEVRVSMVQTLHVVQSIVGDLCQNTSEAVCNLTTSVSIGQTCNSDKVDACVAEFSDLVNGEFPPFPFGTDELFCAEYDIARLCVEDKAAECSASVMETANQTITAAYANFSVSCGPLKRSCKFSSPRFCSLHETYQSIQELILEENDVCSRGTIVMEDLSHSLEGCNSIQRYSAETAFHSLISNAGCSPVSIILDEADDIFVPLTECIASLYTGVSFSLTNYRYGIKDFCPVVQQLSTCLGDYYYNTSLHELPTQFISSHLLKSSHEVLADFLEFCSWPGSDTESNETISEPADCNQKLASVCLKSLLSESLLLGLWRAQDRVKFCSNMDFWKECVTNSTRTCSSRLRGQYSGTVNFTTSMVTQAGVCKTDDGEKEEEEERSCSPSEAWECVANLGVNVSYYRTSKEKGDICKMAKKTKYCIDRHLHNCSEPITKSVTMTLKHVHIYALRMCRGKEEKRDGDDSPPPTCVDPWEGKDCEVARALTCTTHLYKEIFNTFGSEDRLCIVYAKSLQCVYRSTNACPTYIRRNLRLGLDALSNFRATETCDVEVKSPCEAPPSNCSIHKAEICVNKLKSKLMGELDDSVCSLLTEVKECIDSNSVNCPATAVYQVNQEYYAALQVIGTFCDGGGGDGGSGSGGVDSGVTDIDGCISNFHIKVSKVMELSESANQETGTPASQETNESTEKDSKDSEEKKGTKERKSQEKKDKKSEEKDKKSKEKDKKSKEKDKKSKEKDKKSKEKDKKSEEKDKKSKEKDKKSEEKDKKSKEKDKKSKEKDKKSEEKDKKSEEKKNKKSEEKKSKKSEENKGKKSRESKASKEDKDSKQSKDCSKSDSELDRVCMEVHSAWLCIQSQLPRLDNYHERVILNQTFYAIYQATQYRCKSQVCHSCTELDDNELCNKQNPEECDAGEICYATRTDSKLKKGCKARAECELTCASGEDCGYCCRGYLCNKLADQDEPPKCDVRKAIKCAVEVVSKVTQADTITERLLSVSLTCMETYSRDCPSDQLTIIYRIAVLIREMLTVSGCAAEASLYRHCGTVGVLSLGRISSSPFAVDRTKCSLLNRTQTLLDGIEESQQCFDEELKPVWESRDYVKDQFIGDVCEATSESTPTCGSDEVFSCFGQTAATFAQNGSSLLRDQPCQESTLSTTLQCVRDKGKGCSDLENATLSGVISAYIDKTLMSCAGTNLSMQRFRDLVDFDESMAGCISNFGVNLIQGLHADHTAVCNAYMSTMSCVKSLELSPVLKAIGRSFVTLLASSFDSVDACAPASAGSQSASAATSGSQSSGSTDSQGSQDSGSTESQGSQAANSTESQGSQAAGSQQPSGSTETQESSGSTGSTVDLPVCDLDLVYVYLVHHTVQLYTHPLFPLSAVYHTCRNADLIQSSVQTILTQCGGPTRASLETVYKFFRAVISVVCVGDIPAADSQTGSAGCSVAEAKACFQPLIPYLIKSSGDLDELFCWEMESASQCIERYQGDCTEAEFQSVRDGWTFVETFGSARCPDVAAPSGVCSVTEAWVCIQKLIPEKSGCSNLENVTACIKPQTDGCSGHQMAVVEDRLLHSRFTELSDCSPPFITDDALVIALENCIGEFSVEVHANIGDESASLNWTCATFHDLLQCFRKTSEEMDSVVFHQVLQNSASDYAALVTMCNKQSEQFIHYGSCPVVVEGFGGTCPESCYLDADCLLTEKCCSNGCGHVCVAAVGENVLAFDTPEQPAATDYTYIILSNYGHDLGQSTSVTFQVKACSNAYIGLQVDIEGTSMYEIVLGADSNSKSMIRTMKRGQTRIEQSGAVLDCNAFKKFEVAWTGGIVVVKRDTETGSEQLMTWTRPGGGLNIQYIGVATTTGSGSWKFQKPVTEDAVCLPNVASSCITVNAVTNVMAPFFSDDDKSQLCSAGAPYNDTTDMCVSSSIEDCSAFKRQHFKMLHQLSMAVLHAVGVCDDKLYKCDPSSAVHCMSHLAYLIGYNTAIVQEPSSAPSDQPDICSVYEQSRRCVTYNLYGCTSSTRNSVRSTFEELECLMGSLCNVIEEPPVTATPPVCVDWEVVSADAECSPRDAMECLNDLRTSIANPWSPTGRICLSYGLSLQCFVDKLYKCETGLVALAMGVWKEFSPFTGDCTTKLKSPCEEVEDKCQHDKLVACVNTVKDLRLASVEDSQLCVAFDNAWECIRQKSTDCPDRRVIPLQKELSSLREETYLVCEDTLLVCYYRYTDVVIEILTRQPNADRPESQEASKADSKKSSKADSKDSSASGSKENSKSGSKEKKKAGSKENSKSGSKEKKKAGSKENSKEKKKAGSKENSKSGSKENSKAGSKENSKAGSKENSKSGSKENSKSGSKENSKAGSKENSKSGSKENSKAGSKEATVEVWDNIASCETVVESYDCLILTLSNSSLPNALVTLFTDIVSGLKLVTEEKCSGMSCYYCKKKRTNGECNTMVSVCASDKQACETVTEKNKISKGCVSPDKCKPGTKGKKTTHCCYGYLCNELADSVYYDPPTCDILVTSQTVITLLTQVIEATDGYSSIFCSNVLVTIEELKMLSLTCSMPTADRILGLQASFIAAEQTMCTIQVKCEKQAAVNCIASFNTTIRGSASADVICVKYEEMMQCLFNQWSNCDPTDIAEITVIMTSVTNQITLACHKMPNIEYTSPSDMIRIVEGGDSKSITFVLKEDPSANCGTKICRVVISMVLVHTGNDTTRRCADQSLIPQLVVGDLQVAGACGYTFTTDNWSTAVNVPFLAVNDGLYDGDQTVEVQVTATKYEDDVAVLDRLLATYHFIVIDRDQKGSVCTSVNDPHHLTFDNLYYNNFYRGEFTMYRHKTLPYEVRVVFTKCFKASCNCAVIVKSGDDFFMVDVCDKKVPMAKISMHFTQQVTVGTSMFSIPTGERFQEYIVTLPSGTEVIVQVLRRLINVQINPSPLDRGQTEGLCGNYDGDSTNDLMMPDGILDEVDAKYLVPNRKDTKDPLAPKNFNKAWRIKKNFWFFYDFKFQPFTEGNLVYCTCPVTAVGSADTCQSIRRSKSCPSLISGVDLIKKATSLIEGTGQEAQTQARRRRKRQATTDPFADIGIDTDGEVEPASWPVGEWTEEKARTYCEDLLTNSALGQACANLDTAEDTDVSSCMDDIKLTNTTEFGQYSVQNQIGKCKTALAKDPSSTTDPAVVLAQTCEDNCNGNGVCQNGTCTCFSGFMGVACSMNDGDPPVVASLVRNTCDTKDGALCNSVAVQGEKFVDITTLTCHFETVQYIAGSFIKTNSFTTALGNFISYNLVECEMPASLTPAVPLRAVLVSVSNKGATKSSGDHYFIGHDSLCYACTSTSCETTTTGCVIDAKCYSIGAVSSANPCHFCDPVTSVTQWTVKIAHYCPTTPAASTIAATTTTTPTPTTTTPTTTTPSRRDTAAMQQESMGPIIATSVVAAAAFIALIIVTCVFVVYKKRNVPSRSQQKSDSESSSGRVSRNGVWNKRYEDHMYYDNSMYYGWPEPPAAFANNIPKRQSQLARRDPTAVYFSESRN